jgi:hypothetical protein
MERSAIHLMTKRGKSIRQIASELGRSPTTIGRVLREPMDPAPAQRRRRSQVDPYRAPPRAGHYDDLVTALALAVHAAPKKKVFGVGAIDKDRRATVRSGHRLLQAGVSPQSNSWDNLIELLDQL